MTNDTGGPRDDPPRFYKIDRRMMQTYARTIGVNALAIYNALTFHADSKGQCYPSQQTLAEELGISRPTVNKAIQTLHEAGLISVDDRTLPGRGQSAQLYTLNLHVPDVKNVYIGSTADVKESDNGGGRCKESLQADVNDVYSLNRNLNETRINETLNTPPNVAHAHEENGGGGGVADRLAGFSFTDRQVADALEACGDRLTDAVLDRWQVVIDFPPKGLTNPTGAMVKRLTAGDIGVPLNGRPKERANGTQPASLTPEQQQTFAQEKAALMGRLTPPRIKL